MNTDRKEAIKQSMKNAVKKVMKESKTTQEQLAKMLDYSTQSAVAQRLKSDIQISTLVEMMDAMGYEVVLQKNKRGNNPAGQIVINGEIKETTDGGEEK